MNLFKAPVGNFPNFQEKAKFNFVWRITLVFAIVVFLLIFLTFINDDRFVLYYSGVFVISLVSLFCLAYFKTYKRVAKVLYFVICVILNVAVFSIPDALHTQEALWMMVVILSAFFTLGSFWGVTYLIVNTVVYAIYFNFIFESTIGLEISIQPEVLLIMSIEFAVSMFLIGFVMFQYELINSYALKKTSDAFQELTLKKQIVEDQNKEKTILLQEIHHRVKNNLQVIVSLLRLQSGEIHSIEAKECLKDAISRVLTMSLIHQKLYEKESLMNIDIKDYLHTLMKNLIETGALNKKISFNVNSTLNSVNAKNIVPLGLLINELVSNSIKHAFQEYGHIELTLVPGEGSEYLMTYFDNGVWKVSEGKTFGTQLIEVFTEQLDGSFKREINDDGTYYYFKLTNEEFGTSSLQ